MTVTAPPTRVRSIDRARGLAIALMVVDHLLVVIDPTNPLRYTATRLALPLFMFTAAIFHRRITRTRLLHLAPAIAAEFTVAVFVLGTFPGIVTTYALVVLAIQHIPDVHRHALALTTLGLVQALYLPLPITGYQPGIVLAWYSLGLLAASQLIGSPLAHQRLSLLEPLGRHPIAFYVGHLVALVPLAALIH